MTKFTIVVTDKDGVLDDKTIGEQEKIIDEKLGVKMVAIGIDDRMTLSQDELAKLKKLCDDIRVFTVHDVDAVEELLEFIERL